MEKIKYKNKIIQQVWDGKRGSAYSALKKLSLRSDQLQTTFRLPGHVSLNYTSSQSAEVIADYFAQISMEFRPIDINMLPPNIRSYVENTPPYEYPILSELDVYQLLKKSKKPNSSVGCDMQTKIIKNFSVELALPISKIFNSISKSKIYPKHWKIEHGVPIPKIYPPESESDLRIISKQPI